jgi:hypothetical protein
MQRLFAIIAIACVTAGCASTIQIASLATPTNPGKTLSVKDLRYNQPANNAVSIGLRGGTYTVEHESPEGYFYRGPDLCVKIPAVINNNINAYPDSVLPGGLFVSKTSTNNPYRIYYYQLNIPPSGRNVDPGQAEQISQNAAPNAGVVSGAVGAAIGMTLVDAIIASGRGQIVLIPATSEIDIGAFVSKN